MTTLIDYNSPAIQKVLPILLIDHTTGNNIMWATNSYAARGEGFQETDSIDAQTILSIGNELIQPRVTKELSQQQERTKTHAEVFTPSWIVNQMNNYCDEEWFGRPNVFNVQSEQNWKPVEEHIVFPEGKTWQDYINSTRLEITCGEAPYICSRYDAATGEIIPLQSRIGLLDRKLRIVSENTEKSTDWYKWAVVALKSVYGYEFQGDSLLIGRINVLLTINEWFSHKYKRELTEKRFQELSEIIAWNFWQMDGLTDCVPFDAPMKKEGPEMEYSFEGFEDFWGDTAELSEGAENTVSRPCEIMDWQNKERKPFYKFKEDRR